MEIKNKITMGVSFKELKNNRLNDAEKAVLEIISGCEPKTLENGNILWEKDGEGLFCQNFKLSELYISYDIWHILPRDYNIEYNDSQELLKNIMYDYTSKGKLKIIY